MQRRFFASSLRKPVGSSSHHCLPAWVAAGLSLVMAFSPVSALASADARFNLETHTRVDGVDLVLNGAGQRNLLFLDIYTVALYLPKKQSDAQIVLKNDLPRSVRVILSRDISAEHDIEFLLDGLEANNTREEMAAIQEPLAHFLRMIRTLGTVTKGSVVRLDYLPGVGTRVWLNQRLLGNVPGAAFNRSLLKIWLGDQPIQEGLKKALLGVARDAI